MMTNPLPFVRILLFCALGCVGCLSNPLPYIHTPTAPREKELSIVTTGGGGTAHFSYSPDGRLVLHAGGHLGWLAPAAGLFGVGGAGIFLEPFYVDASYTVGRFYSYFNYPGTTYPGTANDFGGRYRKFMLQVNYPFQSRQAGVILGVSSFQGEGTKSYQYAPHQSAPLDFPLVLEPSIYFRLGRRQRLLFVVSSNLRLNFDPGQEDDVSANAFRIGMGYDLAWH